MSPGASATIAALLLAIAVSLSTAIANGSVFYGLDGAYNDALIRQNHEWLPFGLGLSADQIRGAGNILLPVNTNLILMFRLQLALLGDVTPVATAVICALQLFGATYALARAMQIDSGTAIAAGWALGFCALPTVWFPWMYAIYALSPHVGEIVSGTILMVAILLCAGRYGAIADISCAFGLTAIAFYLTLAYPLNVVQIGLAIAVYGGATIASAQSFRERVTKVLVSLLGIAALGATGVFAYLVGLAENTATRFFWDEYLRVQLSTQWASIFFHGTSFSYLGPVAIVMSVLEAAWRAIPGKGRECAMAIAHLVATSIVVCGGWAIVTYVSDWLGPSMLYFEFAMWPFYAIFAVSLFSRLTRSAWSFVPRIGLVLKLSRIPGATLMTIALIPITLAAVTVEKRSGEVTPSFSPYPPQSIAFADQALGQIRLRPGEPFKGRLATFTGIAGTTHVTWGDLHGYDAALYASIGSDLRLIGPWYHGIPTLQEYSQIITPPQFLLQSRYFARPGDKQVRNISLFTRPDLELLRAWGVRYVVADIDIAGAKQLAELDWDSRRSPIKLFELPAPNTGSYSPTVVTTVGDLAGAMAFLTENPDLTRRVALFEQMGGPLHEAKARIEVHRGFLRVIVESPGRALVLLPYEYTSCLGAKVVQGNHEVRLLRANVAQAALLVHGSSTVELEAKYGVPFDTSCRRTDAREATNLGIDAARRAYPPGIGRQIDIRR